MQECSIWAKEYGVDIEKFSFLPDLCTPSKFIEKEKDFDPENIRICHAGSLYPTHGPRGICNHKTMLDDAITLTERGINVHFVLPPAHFSSITINANNNQADMDRYLDWLYEHASNKRMQIIKGSDTDARLISEYDFGFIVLRDMHKYPRFIGRTILSKFALYMEAGIPVMVPASLESIAELVKEHGIGIVYPNTVDGIFERITPPYMSKNIHREMCENVREFRKTFTYEKWNTEAML